MVNSTKRTKQQSDVLEAAKPLVRVYLLGSFRVEWQVPYGGQADAWNHRTSARSLFKLLLLAPERRATRLQLASILWPESDESRALGSLRSAMKALRQVLRPADGQDLLHVVDEGKVLRLPEQDFLWTDIDAFEEMITQARALSSLQKAERLWEQAQALLCGELFADEIGEWLDHRWVKARFTRLLTARRHLIHSLGDLYLQRGQHAEAEGMLQDYVAQFPTDQDALCLLLRTLMLQQRSVEARACYDRGRAILTQRGETLAEPLKLYGKQIRQLTHQLLINAEKDISTKHEDEIFSSQFSEDKGRLMNDMYFSQISSSQLWHVPHLRNPFFTGREELLTHLYRVLHAEKTIVAVTQHALCGLGGIGKTQAVLEYAYRYRQEYRAVFWVKADTNENMLTDFHTIACLLQLPEQFAEDRTVTATAVKRWFQSHKQWLLILDNADDLTLVREFLPPGHPGHILLTTRAQALGGLAYNIQVEEMNQTIGTLFLLRRAGLLPSGISILNETTADVLLAQKFVQEVGGLPLALDQAGAYIEETAASLQEYLDLYHASRLVFLQRRGGLTTDHPESVATTWNLAFTHIENNDPIAASLLRLCAFLASDAIPEDLLFEGIQQVVGSTKKFHRLRFNEALSSLLRFSLVRRNGNAHTITIHRLIQSVIRDTLLLEQQSEWICHVIYLLSSAFPSAIEVTSWPLCEQLLPHALLCAHWIEQGQMNSVKVASFLNTIGYYLNMRARYDMAKPLFQRALSLQKQILGEQHPDTAQTLSNLAYLYHHQDQFEEAMHLLQQSLAIRQNVLGMDHPDTATNLNALALLYRDQGRYEEAEPFFQQALSLRKQIFGIFHPQTAHSLSNLAWLYRNLRKYQEAEALYEQSLSIRKRTLGGDHPFTASSLNGLALLYAAQKKYAEAEPLFQQAVTIRRQVIGTKHLHTTQSMNALAFLYRDQGKYEKAEALLLEVLTIREQILGDNHPRTATSLYNLAILYFTQSKFEQAEPFFQRTLLLRKQLLGRLHPRTQVILTNLTYCQKQMKKETTREASQSPNPCCSEEERPRSEREMSLLRKRERNIIR